MRNINRLNFRDIQALNGLRVCGYAMRADMEKIISRNRVETFLKRGYLEQRMDCRGRSVLTYTDKGKALIKKIDPLQGRTFYPKQPNAFPPVCRSVAQRAYDRNFGGGDEGHIP